VSSIIMPLIKFGKAMEPKATSQETC